MSLVGNAIIIKEENEARPYLLIGVLKQDGDILYYWQCRVCDVGLLNARDDEVYSIMGMISHANSESHKITLMGMRK